MTHKLNRIVRRVLRRARRYDEAAHRPMSRQEREKLHRRAYRNGAHALNLVERFG